MTRFAAAAAILASAGFFAATAQAATILPIGETTVSVVAPLSTLGLGAAPTGTATLDTSGARPLFAFDITGGTVDTSGNALIEHEGSGVQLFALADTTIFAEVGDFLIDTFAGTVSGTVNGAGAGTVLFNFGESTRFGIVLEISSDLAAALAGVFGAPDLTGARFGYANTDPQIGPAPIPLPATLPLLAAGLLVAGLAARRRKAA